MADFWRLILGLATLVGLATGIGTIVGWIASSRTLGQTAVLMVQIAGVAYVELLLCAVAVGFLFNEKTWRNRIVGFFTAVAFVAIYTVGFVLPWEKWWLIVAGVFALPVMIVVTWLLVDSEVETSRAKRKPCPDCLEMVKAQAKICRYCRHAFPDPLPPIPHSLLERWSAAFQGRDLPLETPPVT